MKQIRKIIEIKLSGAELSIRTISKATGVSRPVVKDYLERLSNHPVTLATLTQMNDSQLNQHLELDCPAVQETAINRVLTDWLATHQQELNKRGMTRRILHERYLENHPEGLQYSQFCFVIKQQNQAPETSAMMDHKEGDKFYIDFTGRKLEWQDCADEKHIEEIFLGVLGASGFLYSIPVFSQRQDDFAHAVQSALKSLGGVPHVIVPDCLKSAVLSHDGYEPEINPLFQKLMRHYGTLCLPARPKHPKDKALVEGAVNLIYRQILNRIDGQVFADRTSLLIWWQKAVDKINGASFQKLPGSRQSRFDSIDKPALKPLPLTDFTLMGSLNQTVTTTGVIYISADKTHYSVPYSLHGKKVEILTYPAKLEIWHENQMYASHERKPLAGHSILAEHRPPAHQWYANRNSDELLRTVSAHGLHVASWARKKVLTCEHADQVWQILSGLKKLISTHKLRIDTACRIGLRNEELTLKLLRKILKSEEDLAFVAQEEKSQELPFHENVRGGIYFDNGKVGA